MANTGAEMQSSSSFASKESAALIASKSLDGFEECLCGCRQWSEDQVGAALQGPRFKMKLNDTLSRRTCSLTHTVVHNLRRLEVPEYYGLFYYLYVGDRVPTNCGFRIVLFGKKLTADEQNKLKGLCEDIVFSVKQDLLKLKADFRPAGLGIWLQQEHQDKLLWAFTKVSMFNMHRDGSDDETFAGTWNVFEKVSTRFIPQDDGEVEIMVQLSY